MSGFDKVVFDFQEEMFDSIHRIPNVPLRCGGHNGYKVNCGEKLGRLEVRPMYKSNTVCYNMVYSKHRP